MDDRSLYTALIAVIRSGMDTAADVLEIAQSNQLRAAGRPITRALLLDKVGERRYGHVKREDVPDPDDPLLMIHRETQIYETRIQMGALAKPPPVRGEIPADEPSASDLLNRAAAVLQSDVTIAALRAAGIGVLRILEVRNPVFRNDQDQFEASPSFDFILTHDQVTVTTTPAAIVGELVVASV